MKGSCKLFVLIGLLFGISCAQDATIGFSTFLGGNALDSANSVANYLGKIYVVGESFSTNLATSPHTPSDAFLTIFNGGEKSSYYLGGNGHDSAKGVAIGSDGNIYVVGQTSSTDFPMAGNPYSSNLTGTSDGFISVYSTDGSSLLWSSYFGGSGTESINGVAVSTSGIIYVVGTTTSNNLPTTDSSTLNGISAGFFSVFSASGSLVKSTYLSGNPISGSSTTVASGITLDETNGYVWIVGTTDVVSNWVSTIYRIGTGGQSDAFLIQASSSTYSISSSLFVGGSGIDSFLSVASDGLNIFLGGYTNSVDFPTLNSIKSTLGGTRDGIYVVVSSGSLSVVTQRILTYLGGSGSDQVQGVAFSSTNVYLTGITQSSDFLVTNSPYSKTLSGLSDAFITAFNRSSPQLLTYSTYFGGNESDVANAATASASGLTIVGSTLSINFPTLNALQSTKSVADDAFVTANIITYTQPLSQTQTGEPTGDNVTPYSTGGVQGKKSSRGGTIAGIVLGLLFGSLVLLAIALAGFYFYTKSSDF